MNQISAITNSELDEIVSRIVEVAKPEQVLIFGSTARGTTGPHSDLDILIIKAGSVPPAESSRPDLPADAGSSPVDRSRHCYSAAG